MIRDDALNVLLYSKHSTYSSERVGGAETSFRLMAETLAQAGHNLFYLTTACENGSSRKVIRRSGVNVIFYPPFNKKALIQRLRRKLGGNEIKNIWLKNVLREAITKNKINLVYVSYDLRILDALLKLRDEVGLPFKIVMRMPGLRWYEDVKTKGRLENYQYIFSNVDSVNYVSNGLKQLCEERAAEIGLRLSPRDQFVADIGAKIRVEPSGLRSRRHDTFRLVVATRFSSYQKRHDLLVEAVEILGDRIPIEVLMIGDGPRKRVIEEQIVRKQLADVIAIRPYTKQEELWSILQEYDLLCHPCDYEGLSKIVLEGMALGMPVLVSQVPPFAEFILDGENGYLAENLPAAWARKIEDIFLHFDEALAAAKSGQVAVLEKFDPKRGAIRYETEFRRILYEL